MKPWQNERYGSGAAMEPDGGAIHGGALDEARRRHPHAPEPWIDLSTGINPVPYSLPSLAPESWERLPLASEELDLRRAAAARYGVSAPDMIAAAPGTQALIQIIPRLLQPTRAAVVGPTTYAEHLMAWAREGHEARGVETLAEAAAANVVVAVNPDNPTGRLIPVADLLSVAWALASRGGLLVVDEAFMDTLDPAASLAPVLPPATLVLRSFGKIFGLAGVRLGFAIADRTTSGRLREMLGPWAVSGPALAIGRRALMDGAWLLEARQRLAADALRLDALIAQAGGRVLGGSTLFRLAAHSDAGRVADGLAERGVLVRRFPSQPAWLRFGIPGTEDAWRRLEAALRETTLDETRTP